MNRRYLFLFFGGILVLVLVSHVGAQLTHQFTQINRGKDPKHTPVIKAPDSVKAGEAFEVTVMVGEQMHPSEPTHNIHWIELYAGEVQVARVDLTPTLTQPKVTFSLTLKEKTTLRALSQPNHSAAWEATKEISVTPAPPSN